MRGKNLSRINSKWVKAAVFAGIIVFVLGLLAMTWELLNILGGSLFFGPALLFAGISLIVIGSLAEWLETKGLKK